MSEREELKPERISRWTKKEIIKTLAIPRHMMIEGKYHTATEFKMQLQAWKRVMEKARKP